MGSKTDQKSSPSSSIQSFAHLYLSTGLDWGISETVVQVQGEPLSLRMGQVPGWAWHLWVAYTLAWPLSPSCPEFPAPLFSYLYSKTFSWGSIMGIFQSSSHDFKTWMKIRRTEEGLQMLAINLDCLWLVCDLGEMSSPAHCGSGCSLGYRWQSVLWS